LSTYFVKLEFEFSTLFFYCAKPKILPRDHTSEPKPEMPSNGTTATHRPSESHDLIFERLAAKLRVARSQQEVAGRTADHSKWSQTQSDVDEASLRLNKYMILHQELITASEDLKKAIGTGTSEECAEKTPITPTASQN
jgi:hypothetical protein